MYNIDINGFIGFLLHIFSVILFLILLMKNKSSDRKSVIGQNNVYKKLKK